MIDALYTTRSSCSNADGQVLSSQGELAEHIGNARIQYRIRDLVRAADLNYIPAFAFGANFGIAY